MLKKMIAILMVVALGAVAAGCFPFGSIVGRGEVETRNFDFSDFTKVEVSFTFDVEVVQSGGFSVSVTTNENIFDYLALEKDGDTLRIKLKDGSYTVASLKANVTMPDLFSVTVTGASKAAVSGFNSNHALEVKATGASSVTLSAIKSGDARVSVDGASRVKGTLEAAGCNFSVEGASNIELTGKSGFLNLIATGASHATLKDFVSSGVSVQFSGASSGTVNTSGPLSGSLSGASSLRYFGNPALGEINTSGGSSVSPG